jgi:cytochrome c oxidase assembly protein subunit 15
MIVGLMALGAGVRTMNAGLSCPDWPLCFGKVIPDFHVGVWFEFVHRAYAGIVAILYAVALVIAFRSKEIPRTSKKAAVWGTVFLAAQIIMGGLTVLMLVKAVVVTMHLLLATLFLSCVLWMLFGVDQAMRAEMDSETARGAASRATAKVTAEAKIMAKSVLARSTAFLLPLIVFVQIAIGGLVASTYAGSVCVDWPLCNGKWVPTWKGAIGLQIIHRFYAYALVLLFVGLAIYGWTQRERLGRPLLRLFLAGGVLVLLQTLVGILNLLFFIPPHITVLHQTLAMLLLGVSLKLWFEARA